MFCPFATSSAPITSNNNENNSENGSFTSLVFTTNGGISTEIKQFYSWLSQLLCEKSDVSLIRVHVLNSKKVLVSFKHPLLM